jgi:membrane AbrB-like protein
VHDFHPEPAADQIDADKGKRYEVIMERYLLVVCAGIVGGLAAQRLNVPGGAVVGAMVLSAAAALLIPQGLSVPSHWSTAIQIVLGISLGMTFNRSLLPLVAKALPLALVSTLILLLVAVCMALLASRLGLVDFGTALFGFSPGGMSGMAILAQTEGHQTSIVAFIHLVRIFTLFMVVPLLVRLFLVMKKAPLN